jgi:hypothetical protein
MESMYVLQALVPLALAAALLLLAWPLVRRIVADRRGA